LQEAERETSEETGGTGKEKKKTEKQEERGKKKKQTGKSWKTEIVLYEKEWGDKECTSGSEVNQGRS
jgi:hypothetical protein